MRNPEFVLNFSFFQNPGRYAIRTGTEIDTESFKVKIFLIETISFTSFLLI
jgi:hypothetical protein